MIEVSLLYFIMFQDEPKVGSCMGSTKAKGDSSQLLKLPYFKLSTFQTRRSLETSFVLRIDND